MALGSEKGFETLRVESSVSPWDAENSYRLTRLKHVLTYGSYDEITREYVHTLALNPVYSQAWLGLSEILFEQGKEKAALRALDCSLELSPLSIAFLWDSAIVAFILGRNDVAIKNLSIVAKMAENRRWRVFEVAWEVLDDGELIYDSILTDESRTRYFDFLVHTNRFDKALSMLEKVERENLPAESMERLVNLLIAEGRIEEAKSVWNQIINTDSFHTGLWNGSFENELLDFGFGWRGNKYDELSVSLDFEKTFEGSSSLRISLFRDAQGGGFVPIYQAIPVDSGALYRFGSYVATERWSSKNKIVWSLACEGLNLAVDSYKQSTDWTHIGVEFDTPAVCKVLFLRLYVSKAEDAFGSLSSSVWIDAVELERVSIGSNGSD